MQQFDKFKIQELKNYLYYSDIHDAKIKILKYDREKRILIIEALNLISNVKMTLVFEEVKVFLYIKGNEFGSSDTIISLVVQEDYSFFKNCMKVCGDCFNDSLYLFFQQLSGDELHIISETVFIESLK